MAWLWSANGITISITPADADQINTALYEDRFRKRNHEPFAETSKRKINDVLEKLVESKSLVWTPRTPSPDNSPKQEHKPDLFTKTELTDLWEASLPYKSIPSYSNI